MAVTGQVVTVVYVSKVSVPIEEPVPAIECVATKPVPNDEREL